jgi:hypothetical protein
MKGCMSTTPTETVLNLPPLQLLVEKEARQAAYRLHCFNHLKKISLGTLNGRYLIGNIWLNIPLGRYGSETEAWLPPDGLKFSTAGSLFERGRAGSGVFLEGT